MSRIEAESTEHTLMKGDPSPGPYDNLLNEDGLGDRIRVLELHPGEFDDPISVSLTMHLMSDEPEYEALSYAWGTEICEKPILVDGYPLTVTTNLDIALRHLRYDDEPRFLWIDAICINQQSTTERNHQVQLMGTIYPNAKDVLIWLGPASDSSDFLMRAIENKWNINGAIYPFFEQAVSSFLARSWFYRLWVVQEVSLSHNDAIILCGSRQTHFCTMANYILRQMQHSDSYDRQSSIKYDASPKWLDLAHNHEIEAERIVGGGTELQIPVLLIVTLDALSHLLHIVTAQGTLDLINIFGIIRQKICTDPRDKVYALYGLATSGPDHREDYMSVRPDYSKSVAQVFSAIARLFFSQNLDALYANWPLRSYEGPQFHGVPSWIPDFFFSFSGITTLVTDKDIRDYALKCSFIYFNPHKIEIETPLVRFSDDGMILHAAGIYHGEITQIIPFPSIKDDLHRLIISNPELKISLPKLIKLMSKVFYWGYGPPPSLENGIRSDEDLDELWAYIVDRNLTSQFLFKTSMDRWGVTNGCLREKDIVAGLFGYDVLFILRSRPQGGFWMITTAYQGDSEAVKSLPELFDGHEGLEGFAKYGLEEFEIH